MAKVTSSSTRSKRKPPKPTTITKGQNPQRANRQSQSTAQVSRSGGGTPGSARVTMGRGASSPALPKVPKPQAKPAAAAAAVKPAARPALQSAQAKAARLANRVARGYGQAGGIEKGIKKSVVVMAAKEGLTARNTAPGTISSMNPQLARRIEAMQKANKRKKK